MAFSVAGRPLTPPALVLKAHILKFDAARANPFNWRIARGLVAARSEPRVLVAVHVIAPDLDHVPRAGVRATALAVIVPIPATGRDALIGRTAENV